MGEVYRARDTRLDRIVAIKVLPAALAADPQFRERFDREARAVAALNHPHICTLHDIGRQDGVDFLVMEYLDGETLAERLASGSGLSAPRVEWRFSTGGGAPPPPRTDADASPRRFPAATPHGRRRTC